MQPVNGFDRVRIIKAVSIWAISNNLSFLMAKVNISKLKLVELCTNPFSYVIVG